jgi:uncharacterized membrane protein YedE/YeeE
MPLAINVSVAPIERIEKLAIPQIPCPLVHPLPINRPLIVGAAVFGVGWGMTGYCPGPAVASLGLFSKEGVLMVVAIYAGFFAERYFVKK